MAQGRSIKIISTIKRIRTSRWAMKKSLSLTTLSLTTLDLTTLSLTTLEGREGREEEPPGPVDGVRGVHL